MKSILLKAGISSLLLAIGLALITRFSLKPLPVSFASILDSADSIRLADRNGEPLSISYQSRWNLHDQLQAYEIPALMKAAIVLAEDKRFYEHDGQDWLARFHALWQNLLHLRKVRGASTITEQVVKMLQPRERTVWSRWLEGWQAVRLEQTISKAEILQFYLNQVPYAANRRGIKQASRYYFDRDIDTLNHKELLALAVLVRAPSRLDLYKKPKSLDRAVNDLAEKMTENGLLSSQDVANVADQSLHLQLPELQVNAPHFVRFVLGHNLAFQTQYRTTLNGSYQQKLQTMLDQRLQDLAPKQVRHGGLLLVDIKTNEILAWVVGGNNRNNLPGAFIDTITSYRQPGSSLKPFLYALALSKGWTAATRIEDQPLAESVASGMHQYSNYSRVFYGSVSLRQALANSLNIPALKTIQFVGAKPYLELLKSLDFQNLNRHPDIYGDGLALGSAEVTLFELVQAYSTLANKGIYRPLKFLLDHQNQQAIQILSESVSALISDILSDPQARSLEFGTGTVLNMPVQTAVKTGTSSDYRDSWAVAYNAHVLLGAWMGNLNNEATDGITGSTGPGLLLRSALSWLNRSVETQPLYLSPNLVTKSICIATEVNSGRCTAYRDEYFIAGHLPQLPEALVRKPLRLRQPTPGLNLALDPRLPDSAQAYEFIVQGLEKNQTVNWYVNNELLSSNNRGQYLWPMQRGSQQVRAVIYDSGEIVKRLPAVNFLVK